MHSSSYNNMQVFRDRYLNSLVGRPLSIYDLGASDINGSYKPIFQESGWEYKGLDMEAGKNVDITLKNPYSWREIQSSSVDVLVSGQALEHMDYFWIAMLEIRRILKPGGLCCLIAPSSGYEHKYPVDCYRFFTDGFKALAHFASMEEIESWTVSDDEIFSDDSATWHDTVFIGRRPKAPLIKETVTNIRHFFINKLSKI